MHEPASAGLGQVATQGITHGASATAAKQGSEGARAGMRSAAWRAIATANWTSEAPRAVVLSSGAPRGGNRALRRLREREQSIGGECHWSHAEGRREATGGVTGVPRRHVGRAARRGPPQRAVRQHAFEIQHRSHTAEGFQGTAATMAKAPRLQASNAPRLHVFKAPRLRESKAQRRTCAAASSTSAPARWSDS